MLKRRPPKRVIRSDYTFDSPGYDSDNDEYDLKARERIMNTVIKYKFKLVHSFINGIRDPQRLLQRLKKVFGNHFNNYACLKKYYEKYKYKGKLRADSRENSKLNDYRGGLKLIYQYIKNYIAYQLNDEKAAEELYNIIDTIDYTTATNCYEPVHYNTYAMNWESAPKAYTSRQHFEAGRTLEELEFERKWANRADIDMDDFYDYRDDRFDQLR